MKRKDIIVGKSYSGTAGVVTRKVLKVTDDSVTYETTASALNKTLVGTEATASMKTFTDWAKTVESNEKSTQKKVPVKNSVTGKPLSSDSPLENKDNSEIAEKAKVINLTIANPADSDNLLNKAINQLNKNKIGEILSESLCDKMPKPLYFRLYTGKEILAGNAHPSEISLLQSAKITSSNYYLFCYFFRDFTTIIEFDPDTYKTAEDLREAILQRFPSESQLPPCPVCGHSPVIMCGKSEGYYVSCDNCHASTGVYQTAEDARKAWEDAIAKSLGKEEK